MITSITGALFAGITIILPMESAVRGTEVELGEVATIQGADAATQAALEAIELGGAPTPGYQRVLDRTTIAGRVRRVLPELDFQFAGKRTCRVFPETHLISSTELQAAVDAELARAVAGRDITWQLKESLGAVQVPLGSEDEAGEPSLQVILQGTELASGVMNIAIRVVVDGSTYRTVWADWDIAVWGEMPVLTRNLLAGSSVTPALFELRRSRLPAGGSNAVLTPASMVGAVANRNLIAGNVVLTSDVTRPKILRTGEHATLVVKKGVIRAKIAVVVLEDAGIGDSVRVRREDDQRVFEGVVLTRELIEMNLDG